MSLHLVSIDAIINKYTTKLDVFEFIDEIDDDIDKLYIDKFWDSIQSDK